MSLKKINEKIGDKELKIRYTMKNLKLNPNSPLKCDKCHKKLGLLRMIGRAGKVKSGKEYIVRCKHCDNLNIRIKGEIGRNIDRDWEKFGF